MKAESRRIKPRLFFICEGIVRNYSYFVNYFMFKVSKEARRRLLVVYNEAGNSYMTGVEGGISDAKYDR